MTNRDEPVGNTCPIIDEIKEYIENAINSGDSENDIKYWLGFALHDIEKVRDANLSLRHWGQSLVSDLEAIEKEHKDELERLENEVYELEYSIKHNTN